MPSLKESLKQLRFFKPFNTITTSVLRAGYRASHIRPGRVVNYLRRIGVIQALLPNGRLLKFYTNDDDDGIANSVFWHGWAAHEAETTRLFFRLAARSQVTFDAGGHIGFHALIAAHANPQGQVYTFEPFPAVAKRLEYNISLNKVRNIHCLHSALGESDGTAEFFVHDLEQIADNSSLRADNVQKSLQHLYATDAPQPTQCLKVQLTSVDTFVRDNGLEGINLIKLDTEGTEPDVLRGMPQTLQRCKPHIICEVLCSFDTGPEIEEILGPLGYRYYWLTDDGPVLRDHIEPQVGGRYEFRNYLFTTLEPDKVARL